MSVLCSDTFELFCSILSRVVGFQMLGTYYWSRFQMTVTDSESESFAGLRLILRKHLRLSASGIVTGCTRTGYFVCTRFVLVPVLYQYIHAQIKLTLHFQSGTITLATLTSLLLKLVWRFAGRILPIWNLLKISQAANVRLATPNLKLPRPSVNLRDVAA